MLAVANVFGSFGRAEVQPARQFAHHENIDPVALALFHQGTGMGEFFPERDRAEIGEELKFLAESQQGGAFGTFVLGDRWIAIGQADGAEKNGVGRFTEGEGGIGESFASGVNAGPTHGRFVDRERRGNFCSTARRL